MRPRRLLPPLVALAAGGCLPPEIEVEGQLLFPGRNVEKPAFVALDDRLWVSVEVHTSRPLAGRAGTYDLWLVGFEDGERRKVVGNVSTRDGWRPQEDRVDEASRWFMIDERRVETPPAGDTPVATLVRVHLTGGERERIADVSSYALAGEAGMFYRRVTSGARLPELIFRKPDGRERSLGPVAGAHQLVGRRGDPRDVVYFVTGEDRVFSRIEGFDGPVQALRKNVTRFMLRGDEKVAIISTIEAGKSQTLALDLVTREERKLPGQNACCWRGFDGDVFLYSEPASGGAPGVMRQYDVAADRGAEVTLPLGLQDVSAVMPRPGTGEGLYFDSRGRIAQYREGGRSIRLLDFRALNPKFIDDGRSFIYVEPEVQGAEPEGRLMIRGADFEDAPRQLSPHGSLLQHDGYFFLNDEGRTILVFWAHFGRDASDLYFADHRTGEWRVVAEGISEVQVTPRRVLGIVRVSQQDLVGDLVRKNLPEGDETVLAYRVADAAFYEVPRHDDAQGADYLDTRVAFVVRDRVDSRRDGLWGRLLVTPAAK